MRSGPPSEGNLMPTDVEIMQRVQAGETSLFAELVQRHQSKLLRFAESKLANRAEAEDTIQDAFLAAFHARDSYSPEFAFSTWMWTITLNLTRRTVQKRVRDRDRREGYASCRRTDSHGESPLNTLLKAEQSEQLNHWLSLIPEPQGDAIRLKFFGELTYAEIALTMDCSESGAKRRVKNGLIKLADIIANED